MVDKRREEEAGAGAGAGEEAGAGAGATGGKPPQPFITRVTLVSFSSFGGVFSIGIFVEISASMANIGLFWTMFAPL